MRERRGRIVLVDFGLGDEVARLQDGTRDVGLAGTPLHLAPELFRGHPVGHVSEIYAVGVLLYYLVTGNFPVFGRTNAEMAELHEAGVRSHLHDEEGIPDVFAEVVEHALAPDPTKRFQSAGKFRMALRHALSELGGPTDFPVTPGPEEIPPPPPPAPEWSLLRRGLTLIAAITVVALAGLLVFSLAPRTPPPSPVQLTLSPPPDGFVEGSRNVPAVSPDGKKIAFVGKQGKEALLFVPRPLADGSARHPQHDGSESAVLVAWRRVARLFPDERRKARPVADRGDRRAAGASDGRYREPRRLVGQGRRPAVHLDPHSGLQTMKASRNAKIRFATKVDKGARKRSTCGRSSCPMDDASCSSCSAARKASKASISARSTARITGWWSGHIRARAPGNPARPLIYHRQRPALHAELRPGGWDVERRGAAARSRSRRYLRRAAGALVRERHARLSAAGIASAGVSTR